MVFPLESVNEPQNTTHNAVSLALPELALALDFEHLKNVWSANNDRARTWLQQYVRSVALLSVSFVSAPRQDLWPGAVESVVQDGRLNP